MTGRPGVSVAIVGGGITGLASAYYVEQAAREEGWDLNGVLVEQGSRLGGKLLTVEEEGFLVEGGPDSFLAQKPWGVRLAKELGMEHDLLPPQRSDAMLLHRGRLHPIPNGVMGLAPSRPWALWKASFLSLKGKARASLEPFVRPRRDETDESLGAFLRRRLGAEVAERLAETFTAGVYAGDARELGLRATFPMLAEWEERHGSMARAMRASRAGSHGSSPDSPFRALRKGMGSLPQAIVGRLRGFTLLADKRATGLSWGSEGYRLSFQDGGSVAADVVILAVPAHSAAPLVRSVEPGAATLLERLPFASTASVSLAFQRDRVAHPLTGSGFLVPRSEPSHVTGCTWSSSKWPGRAPEGWVLFRVFVGWSKDDSFMGKDDAALVREAAEALRPLLGLRGEPERAWVHRWPLAMPQYLVGHRAWLDAVKRSLAGWAGLFLAGASYGGVGVPDCIRQAEETAMRVRDLVSRRSPEASQGSRMPEKGLPLSD